MFSSFIRFKSLVFFFTPNLCKKKAIFWPKRRGEMGLEAKNVGTRVGSSHTYICCKVKKWSKIWGF